MRNNHLLYQFLFLVWVFPFLSFSQNLRVKTFQVTDSIFLDSLSVIPNSVLITNVPKSNFVVSPSPSCITWKNKPSIDSILVTYRVFPFNLSEEYYHKNPDLIAPDPGGTTNPFKYSGNSNELSFISSDINKNGSISRGVSFGNNQSLAVNSNLNLQLSGKVSDDISILAAVTDDNIPIQADGNTQQLQEFDKVYIQLFNDKNKLTAGDFQLKSSKNHFLKYFKKTQGGSFSTVVPVKNGTMNITTGIGVSRGKFSRNIIQGIEGNQGPYRLTGADGETFIIVLSGTERVFIDGKQLTRGQENDYIIDYNTAELTFTAQQLVTKDKRIVVEFQYSDRNYARSLIQFSDHFHNDKIDLRFNVYSESDAKNQPLQQDLSDDQKLILENIGDSTHKAFASSVKKIEEFSENFILYKMVDTLFFDPLLQDSILFDSVFVFSTNPDSAFYQLSFSNVGEGNGSYQQQVGNLANGRNFEWVGPGNGSYEPIILLVAPKKRQMTSLGGQYRINQNTVLSFEAALSNNDVNTFSRKDAQDNTGYAFLVDLDNTKALGKGEQKKITLNTSFSYELVEENFTGVERFRRVEFFRDWNLRNTTLSNNQHILGTNIELNLNNVSKAIYSINSYNSGDEYQGIKHGLNFFVNNKGFFVDWKNSLTTSSGTISNTNFIRSKGVGSKTFRFLKIGIRTDSERNHFFDPVVGDSLLSNSYRFAEWEGFITNADSSNVDFKLSYTKRNDFGVRANSLGRATEGTNYAFELGLLKNKNATLTNKTSYRVLLINDSSLTSQKADSTWLNRINYHLKFFKGAIIANSFYEIGAGLEAKKELRFEPTIPGSGTHIHNDLNGDGERDLNEFEIAPPSSSFQADFVKRFVTTNDFVKILSNQFSQTFILNPKVVWRKEKGIKKTLSRFNDQFSYLINKKVGNDNVVAAYNPFDSDGTDTTLVSQNSSLRNTVSFNRANPKFGAIYTYYAIQNKTLLTEGFEERTNKYHSPDIRWNLNKKYRLNLKGEQGVKTNSSDFLSSRDYKINYYSVEPKLTYQPGTKFRVALFYEHKNKQNISENNELALYHTGGSELKISAPEKGSLTGSVNFVYIDYPFPSNTSVSFEMLEGLQPGQNLTWEFLYQKTMANNLQLSINYSGRWANETKVVHVGGVQVRAFF